LPVKIARHLTEYENWRNRFLANTKLNPYADESLSLLRHEGIDVDALIRTLYDYTHPRSVSHLRAVRKWAGDMSKMLATAQKVAGQTLGMLSADLPNIHLAQTAFESLYENQALQALEDAATLLEPLLKHYKTISSQRGKARNEEILVYLCLRIEVHTGRPHWEDLAYLLEAAFEAHGQSEEWDEDAVRKIVTRFEKAQSHIYNSMREFLELSHPTKIPARSPVSRSTRNRRVAPRKSRTAISFADPRNGHQRP
jgi:hypothetical protein